MLMGRGDQGRSDGQLDSAQPACGRGGQVPRQEWTTICRHERLVWVHGEGKDIEWDRAGESGVRCWEQLVVVCCIASSEMSQWAPQRDEEPSCFERLCSTRVIETPRVTLDEPSYQAVMSFRSYMTPTSCTLRGCIWSAMCLPILTVPANGQRTCAIRTTFLGSAQYQYCCMLMTSLGVPASYEKPGLTSLTSLSYNSLNERSPCRARGLPRGDPRKQPQNRVDATNRDLQYQIGICRPSRQSCRGT